MRGKYKARRGVKCIASGKQADEYHHIMTQKAYPEFRDMPWNLAPVTRETHSEWHNKGTGYMALKYKGVLGFLKFNGWLYEEVKGKWSPPAFLNPK